MGLSLSKAIVYLESIKMRLQVAGLACILSVGLVKNCSAQEMDTIPVLKEVVISGIRSSLVKETSLNIQSLSVGKIRQSGALNVSDALSKLPGISQLTTGPAITKPVIRGLYGNRVLAVLSGLKFDNQQWQDEHSRKRTPVPPVEKEFAAALAKTAL